MLADTLVEYWPGCWSSVGQDVGQVSADMSVEYGPRCRWSSAEMLVEYQPTCRSSIGRDVGVVSAEMSVEYQWRCRWRVGRDVGRV